MNGQGRYQSRIRCIFIFLLILFVTGCGGGNAVPEENSSADDSANSAAFVYADTGDIIAVRVNQDVTLNGSGSRTTTGEPLLFDWSFTHKPYASDAVLHNTTSATPDFHADVPGTYMVQLIVTSGDTTSQRAIAFVEVTIDGNVTGKRLHTSYSTQCSNCHDGRFAEGKEPLKPVLPKSPVHLATSNKCEACHTTFGFDLIRFVDHVEIFGSCSSCHNGTLAIGKSGLHIKTNLECDNCHKTNSFLDLGPDGNFDHSGITSGCSACHNGSIAIGKHADHITTETECNFCHTTINFKDAYVDHSVITGDCASCHNGTDAIGQTVGHPVMNIDCGVCHNIKKFSLDGIYNHRVVDSAIQPCASCHNDDNSINARGKSDAVNHLITSTDCGICHGIGGGNFANGIYDHTGIIDNCVSCHIKGGTASGVPDNHIPTSRDCHVCHSPGTFTTGIFDHDPAVVDLITCTSCHNGLITAGMDIYHIPTSEDCRACHLRTDTFAGAIFDHAGVTNNCASCHNGNISTGKNSNHLPTNRDCSDCHIANKFDNFTGATFDHLGVSNTCASCHNGVIAMDKKVNHIPSLTECSQCHIDTNTGGFSSSTFISSVHPAISGGCEGCHNPQFLADTPTVIKASNHLPTDQDCHFCHTNDVFTPQIFNHTDISGNCSSCHNGNYVASAGALGKTPEHPATTADCGLCHSITTFVGGFVDHNGPNVVGKRCDSCHGVTATGKNIGHPATNEDCSVCHVPGTFIPAVFEHVGIIDNCASCHNGTNATGKSGTHLPTTEDCSACHNPTAFAGAKFDHSGILNNCVLCHDGIMALGKNSNHVPTSGDCSDCHQTTGFIPGSFDHVGIVDNCQSCHNGVFAQGKTTGHVATSQDCGVCHNLGGFIPATYDHSSISTGTRCDSCHGVSSTGKPTTHFATSLDCRSCHSTASFVGGSWIHDSSASGTCDTCHSRNGGARDKPPTHFSTDLQCDVCHSISGWAPTNFSHNPNGNYPGDHRIDPGCGGCHGATVTSPFVYPSSTYQPFCAACHAGDFSAESDHNGGKNGTIEQNKDCSGGGRGCHRVSDNGFG